MKIVDQAAETVYIQFAGGPLAGKSIECEVSEIPDEVVVESAAENHVEFVYNHESEGAASAEDMGSVQTTHTTTYHFDGVRKVFVPHKPVPPGHVPPNGFEPQVAPLPHVTPAPQTHNHPYGDDVFADGDESTPVQPAVAATPDELKALIAQSGISANDSFAKALDKEKPGS